MNVARSLCYLSLLALPPSVVVLTARVASAQATITQPKIYPDRYVGDNVKAQRGSGSFPNGINHEDCVQDLKLRFDLLFTNYTSDDQLEAWAGTPDQDCSQPL